MSRFADLLKQAETAHQRPASAVRAPVQPSLRWSVEQERFLQSQAPQMVLTALAGSGKTSALLEYARRRPHQKWNFIVFNRAVAETVAARAPKNMTVRTAHQMAYAHFGHDLHHKIRTDFVVEQVASLLSVPDICRADYAQAVISTLMEYLNSSDAVVSDALISDSVWMGLEEKYADTSWDKARLVSDVQHLWRQCLDPTSELFISHDVYLKRFSMVQAPWRSSHWMLDEGQDWSDAFLSAFSQCASVSIRAGDPFQKLYEWRGASTAPWRTTEAEFWLTRSFRSGGGIEPWVNLRLKALHCSKTWLPASHACSVTHAEETVENIVHFSPSVMLASRWSELRRLAAALQSAGVEHTLLTTPQTPIKGIALSTIHAAKGLEYERVWIGDQGLSPDDNAVVRGRMAYVALTRAQHALRVPQNWPKLEQNVSVFDDE